MELLSTGQAARLCAVTPDTVLKWIKAGKLRATRTAGGHYRIRPEHLPLAEMAGAGSEATTAGATATGHARFCWEFYSQDGEVPSECEQCLVYRSRALRCFEMSRLGRDHGYRGAFCKSSCERCEYYQAHHPGLLRVLVVTDSHELERSLDETTGHWFEFRFTNCEYDCSALVGSFRPHCVVVDCALPPDECKALCCHLCDDPRLEEVSLLIARGPNEPLPSESRRFSRLPKPVSAASLQRRLDGMARRVETVADAAAATRRAVFCVQSDPGRLRRRFMPENKSNGKQK